MLFHYIDGCSWFGCLLDVHSILVNFQWNSSNARGFSLIFIIVSLLKFQSFLLEFHFLLIEFT